MKSPILGSSYVARSVNAAANRMVNLFPEIVPEGGKEPAFLNRAPGLRPILTVGPGPIRGLHVVGSGLVGATGALVVASGDKLYYCLGSIDSLVPQLIGTILNDGEPVSMADNGTQVMIASGGAGYIYNIDTHNFTIITAPSTIGTVAYLDGYFVYNEPDSQKIWVTALFDGTVIDPLDFASAEASPDKVLGIVVDHRELWIFGENSTEVWYNAGNPGFPFAPIQGAFTEVGCSSPYSAAKLDNSIFWLGSDARGTGIVYRAKGYGAERVSTHAVEWQIQQYDYLSNARAYTYQQDGHSFYVLTFPDADATWVYDASTGAWHERGGWNGTKFVRHQGNCQASFGNKVVIGDFLTGQLYYYDLGYYADPSGQQKWLRSWRALPPDANNLKRTAHHSLQLDCEAGVGDGFINPSVSLRSSDDGGHTWSNPRAISMGYIAEYDRRVIWRRLGMTTKLRDRVYEVSSTDPCKVVIMGAEILMSPTNA